MQIQWSTFQMLTEGNVKRYVPESAGVYLLWLQLKNDQWKCYYAGQATDLQQRLLGHLSENEENECIRNHVINHVNGYVYALVSRQSDRDGIEKYLYDTYRPECNKNDPGGTPIVVNLPSRG